MHVFNFDHRSHAWLSNFLQSNVCAYVVSRERKGERERQRASKVYLRPHPVHLPYQPPPPLTHTGSVSPGATGGARKSRANYRSSQTSHYAKRVHRDKACGPPKRLDRAQATTEGAIVSTGVTATDIPSGQSGRLKFSGMNSAACRFLEYGLHGASGERVKHIADRGADQSRAFQPPPNGDTEAMDLSNINISSVRNPASTNGASMVQNQYNDCLNEYSKWSSTQSSVETVFVITNDLWHVTQVDTRLCCSCYFINSHIFLKIEYIDNQLLTSF